MEENEKEIEFIRVFIDTVETTDSGNKVTFKLDCVGVNLDDKFINLQLKDSKDYDIVSIPLDTVTFLASKKFYAGEE